LFSRDGGIKPICHKSLLTGFYDALKNIGMGEDEISKRGLCLHAWRHFCNTELQKAGLSIKQVQAVTGHRSERITEWYSHFDALEFAEVPRVQKSLLSDDEASEPENPGRVKQSPVEGLYIVKPPVRETA
jgi:integrase